MKFGDKLKEIFSDVQILIQDMNYKPFIRPILVIILAFGLVYFLNDRADKQVNNIQRKIAAQKAEFENETDYKAAKTKYQSLLAQLPPANQKNEWILLQIGAIVNSRGFQGLNYSKGSNSNFGILEISTATISGKLNYRQIGLLAESIENNPQFLRMHSMDLSRNSDKNYTDFSDKINFTMHIYTAFLEDHKVLGNASGRK